MTCVETSHALTFACGWSACALNASKVSPPGLESVSQALFQGLWSGVGSGLGALLGGAMWRAYGARVLWRVAGCGLLAGTAAAGAVFLAERRAAR